MQMLRQSLRRKAEGHSFRRLGSGQPDAASNVAATVAASMGVVMVVSVVTLPAKAPQGRLIIENKGRF